MGGERPAEQRPANAEIQRSAEEMLTKATKGEDFSQQYNSLTPDQQREALTAMRGLQQTDMTKFGNVTLTDSNQDGILDDATSTQTRGRLNPSRYINGANHTVDVYNTKQEAQAQTVQHQQELGRNVNEGLIGFGTAQRAGQAINNRAEELRRAEEEILGNNQPKK